MTVILAAYCDDGKSAVIAADRMAVRGAGVSAALRDDAVCKIVKLTDSLAFANTGYMFDSQYVKDEFHKAQNGEWSVSQACNFISEKLAELQMKKRDAEVQRQLGTVFTYKSLAEACSKGAGGVFIEVMKAANELNYGSFLMIGADDDKITIRCDPAPETIGVVEVSWMPLGSGHHYAHAAMTIADHTKAVDLETAIFNVYCGVKAAAVSYGVGSIIDIATVNCSEVRFVPMRAVNTLEDVRVAKSLTNAEKATIRAAIRSDDAANSVAEQPDVK